MALAASQERGHLAESVRTRDLIRQAKGALLERHELTGEVASPAREKP